MKKENSVLGSYVTNSNQINFFSERDYNIYDEKSLFNTTKQGVLPAVSLLVIIAISISKVI